MDDTQIDDFKQFIAATITQHTSDLATKNDVKKLGEKIDDLDLKVDTVSLALNEKLDEKFDEHDIRLKKLERAGA